MGGILISFLVLGGCVNRVNAIRTLVNAFINSLKETVPEKVH